MKLAFLLLTLSAARLAGSDLPAPGHVRIDSYNMVHILRWDPVEAPNEVLPVTYDVEFQTYDHVQELCAHLTETWCNFTGKIQNFHRGKLKVRAQLEDRRSDWSITKEFQGNKDTTIGPVQSLSLHPDVGGLTVYFLPPFPSIPRDWHMDYVLYYWKKNSMKEEIVQLYSSTTHKLKNLEPWTEYCVRVNVSTGVIDGQTSNTVCETTLGTNWTVAVVLAILLMLIVSALVMYFLPKHSARIKNLLKVSYSIPPHIQEYLEDPPSNQCVASTDLTSEEECDHISIVESESHYYSDGEGSSDHGGPDAEKT